MKRARPVPGSARRHAERDAASPRTARGIAWLPHAERGITYLALLLAVALTSGALAASATVWSHHQRREREAQLLWAGDQYRRAIESYANAAGVEQPPGLSRFPPSLEALLDDHRTPVPRRHLRRLFDDPMTPGGAWGLVRDEQGGITGVYSLHDAKPIRTARFPRIYEHFANAKTYQDWRFGIVRSAAQAAAEAARAAREAASAAAAASAADAGERVPGFTPTPVAPAPLPPVPPQDDPPVPPPGEQDPPADTPPGAPEDEPPDDEPSPEDEIDSPESPSEATGDTPADTPANAPAEAAPASRDNGKPADPPGSPAATPAAPVRPRSGF